ERMGAQGADPFGEAPKLVRLHEVLTQVKERFPQERERIQVEVERASSEDCRLTVRAAVEALSALTKNAIDASPNGEPVVLKAVESLNGGVRFIIRDHGVGMTPEVLERVAEPFFTTKPTGQGMLSLHTCLPKRSADSCLSNPNWAAGAPRSLTC